MKRKVLLVAFGGLGNGGVTQVILTIIGALQNQFDFEILCFDEVSNKNELLKTVVIHKIDCSRSSNDFLNLVNYLFRPFKIFFRSVKLFLNNKYDVIHCNNADEGGLILLAAALTRIPIRIMHSHNTKSPFKRNSLIRIYRGLQNTLINRYSNVKIGCSKGACEAMFRGYASEIVYNTINFQNFYRDKISDDIHFIQIGRFTSQKNQLFTLEVFKSLTNKLNIPLRLTLIGWGPDEIQIKGKINELGIKSIVTILPPDTDIPKQLSNADFLLFPSTYEGFGIVALEAQAAGVFCFVSEFVPEEVDLGLCKFMPINSPEKWVDEIIEFIKNDELNAIKSIKVDLSLKFNLETISNQYAKIYNGI